MLFIIRLAESRRLVRSPSEIRIADVCLVQTNYSQLYLTIWDHLLGTVNPLSSEEMEKQYAMYKRVAQEKEAELEQ